MALMVGRKNRDPNFTQEQLDFLVEEVSKSQTQLFCKTSAKEEKEMLWEDIAERLNSLDPKGFRRSGYQVKRKYIKYQSELRTRQKQLGHDPNNSSISLDGSMEAVNVQSQPDMTAQPVNFVDLMTMIPESNVQAMEPQVHITEGEGGDTVVARLEPITAASRRREEMQREKISLQKIGLYMKMKKYQKMEYITPTDVRLITKWIKAPHTMPFRK